MADVKTFKHPSDYIIMNSGGTYKWVPPTFTRFPEDKRPIFVLQRLTSDFMAKLDTVRSVYKRKGGSFSEYNMTKRLFQAMDEGLKGWENFRTPDGDEIPFTHENKNNLHPKIKREIGQELLGEAEVSDEEAELLE